MYNQVLSGRFVHHRTSVIIIKNFGSTEIRAPMMLSGDKALYAPSSIDALSWRLSTRGTSQDLTRLW